MPYHLANGDAPSTTQETKAWQSELGLMEPIGQLASPFKITWKKEWASSKLQIYKDLHWYNELVSLTSYGQH